MWLILRQCNLLQLDVHGFYKLFTGCGADVSYNVYWTRFPVKFLPKCFPFQPIRTWEAFLPEERKAFIRGGMLITQANSWFRGLYYTV